MKRIFLCVLVLCAGLTACTGQSSSQNSTSNTAIASAPATASTSQGSMADQTPLATTSHLRRGGGGGGGGGGGRTEEPTLKQNVSLIQTSSQNNTTAADRKIIRNAELNLESTDPEAAQRSITTIAESKGGFVVESQQSSSDIQSTAGDIVMMSVRVPSEKFSETLDEMRKIATRVVVETVKGEDVTEEFIDIEAQLKAKKALEEQFMLIMKRANWLKFVERSNKLRGENDLSKINRVCRRSRSVYRRRRFLRRARPDSERVCRTHSHRDSMSL
jgi:hypothetical protein